MDRGEKAEGQPAVEEQAGHDRGEPTIGQDGDAVERAGNGELIGGDRRPNDGDDEEQDRQRQVGSDDASACDVFTGIHRLFCAFSSVDVRGHVPAALHVVSFRLHRGGRKPSREPRKNRECANDFRHPDPAIQLAQTRRRIH